MSSPRRRGLPSPIVADLAKGSLTAILIPITLGLVVQPLLLPQLSLPLSPAVWFSGLALTALGLAVVAVALRTLTGSFRDAEDRQPTELCTAGLFAYVRNPIYLGGVVFVAGIGLVLVSSLVLFYTAFLWLFFHRLVVRIEEPQMLRLFPDAYPAYATQTPRWIPRLWR